MCTSLVAASSRDDALLPWIELDKEAPRDHISELLTLKSFAFFKSKTDSDDICRLAESFGRAAMVGYGRCTIGGGRFISKYVVLGVLVTGFLLFAESMILTDFAEHDSIP
jgi:hypothetical protein